MLAQAGDRIQGAGRALEALGPAAVLKRGYAILEHARTGVIVTDAGALAPGDALRARLHKGEAELGVTRVRTEDDSGTGPDR